MNRKKKQYSKFFFKSLFVHDKFDDAITNEHDYNKEYIIVILLIYRYFNRIIFVCFAYYRVADESP
jgi:hypothetical protein